MINILTPHENSLESGFIVLQKNMDQPYLQLERQELPPEFVQQQEQKKEPARVIVIDMFEDEEREPE